MLNISAFNVVVYDILRNLIEIVLCFVAEFNSPIVCFVFKICSADARKFGKGVVLLYSLELAQCRLLGQVRL